MASNDGEVLAHLLTVPDLPPEVSLIAFAMYAFEKVEWAKEITTRSGNPPDQATTDAWIANWTDIQFLRLTFTASEYFDRAARDYMTDEIEEAKQSVRTESIIREVRAAGGFWRQLFFATLTAILGPLLIAGLLVLAAGVKNIPTPTDIVDYVARKPPMAPTGPAPTPQPSAR